MAVGVKVGVFVTVSVGVVVGVTVGVGVFCTNQLFVLPESIELVGKIAAERRLTLSWASTHDALAVVGFTYHNEPFDDERSERY